MTITTRFILCLQCFVLGFGTAFGELPQPMLEANFDDDINDGLARRILLHRHVTLAESGGPDGSNAIRVAYVGYDLGSERVVFNYPLTGILDQATLTFDVMFEQGFQFTLGGKLHGLGPSNPRTGGAAPRADRWAARLMFNQHGRVSTFLSDQDTIGSAAGDSSVIGLFQPGRWYRIVVQVSLNDVGQHNGFARLWVDGVNVASTWNRAIRGTAHNDARIRNFMFSTFHGGGSPPYAPVDEDGNYTTVFAKYDNFRVYDGLVLPRIPAFSLPYEVPAVARAEDYEEVLYIDPSGVHGNGSLEAPYNTFQGLTLEAGTAYLIRRGTVLNEPLDKSWNDVLVGAYGEGEMPVLNQGLRIRGDSRDTVFRDLHIRRAGNGQISPSNNVIDFEYSHGSRAITIAYCRILGANDGNGYPWHVISNASDQMVFFHNEVANSRETGWRLNGRDIRIVRNWFHNTNKDGESGAGSPGAVLYSTGDLTNGYIAGNYLDKRNAIGKHTLMIEHAEWQGGNPVRNVRALHNTIHAPKPGMEGTAVAVRWEPGLNGQFRRNLVNSLPNLVTPFHTTAAAAHGVEPYGIRDNHILRQAGGLVVAFDQTTLNASNTVFSSFAANESFLSNNPALGIYGSDIDPDRFWDEPVIDDHSGLMPSMPQQVYATVLGHRRVQLTWDPSDHATHYDIYRSQGGSAFEIINSVSNTSFVDQGLRSGLTYSYRVLAGNEIGSSVLSPPIESPIPFRQSVWEDFPVDPNGWVNTESGLGHIHVELNPWIYSEVFRNWIHIPNEGKSPQGNWIYVPKRSTP